MTYTIHMLSDKHKLFSLVGCLPFSADSCIRVLPAFVEAFARKDKDAVVIQWAVDSAFRFFPLVHGPARESETATAPTGPRLSWRPCIRWPRRSWDWPNARTATSAWCRSSLLTWRGRLVALVADGWLGWCDGDDRLLMPRMDRGEAASCSPGQALPITESSDKSGKRVVIFLIVRSEGFARLSRRW